MKFLVEMTEAEKDELVRGVKTMCCDASWVRKGRANYRCTKCDKDVTLEIVCLVMALDDSE